MKTINPDGSPVLIEAVYWQYRAIYSAECDSIEQAMSYLEAGEEYGSLASVGVFVDGRPHRVESDWGLDRGRTDEEMLAAYAQCHPSQRTASNEERPR